MSRSRHPILLAALAAALGTPLATASAQTIYVDASHDVVDFGGLQRVADLPGPDGHVSLPEAGLASDNTPGVQTIGFRIPQSDWQYQQFFPGRAVLRPFLGFRTFDTVILDARTQTAFTGDTHPGGGEVVIWQESYLIDSHGGAIFGFDNSNFHVSGGSGNLVQGNTACGIEVFDSTDNLVGGTNPGEGNDAFTIEIDRASNNVVVGNVALRVRVLGWIAGGQAATNNRIGGPSAAERNFIIGSGYWDGEGAPNGYVLQLFDTIGTRVENNWIGTTPDGMAPGSLATTSGVWFDGENHDALILDNRIAGIIGEGRGPHYSGWRFGSAIWITGTGADLTLQGNAIGLDALGRPLLGSVKGLLLDNYYLGPVQRVRIGGAGAGEGNEIAGHLLAGVWVSNAVTDARISGNSIHDNGGLGIDLIDLAFANGVTPNDALDADAGANGLQNFPVLRGAQALGGGTWVSGELESAPFGSFALEFFASPSADPSGHGEGTLFLGRLTVQTDAAGRAAFAGPLPVSAPRGWVASATATQEATGATSEFSAAVPIRPLAPRRAR